MPSKYTAAARVVLPPAAKGCREAFEKMCFERNLPLYWDETIEDQGVDKRFENMQGESNGIISSFPEPGEDDL